MLALSFFLSRAPCPPALPKWFPPPRRFRLPLNLPLLSLKNHSPPYELLLRCRLLLEPFLPRLNASLPS